MTKKINIAIIEVGRIAEQHLKAIKKNHGFRLSVICDLNKKKMK